jgi:CheY-like chemotaxis protein
MDNRTPGSKSILVVDDEADVRLVLNALLTRCGYSVAEATDGREALDMLANAHFDLIILDLMMPRLTGEEVLDELRSDGRLGRIQVIVLTARSQRKDIEKGYKKGAAFFVVKPFNNKTILELVRCLIENLGEEEREELLLRLLE